MNTIKNAFKNIKQFNEDGSGKYNTEFITENRCFINIGAGRIELKATIYDVELLIYFANYGGNNGGYKWRKGMGLKYLMMVVKLFLKEYPKHKNKTFRLQTDNRAPLKLLGMYKSLYFDSELANNMPIVFYNGKWSWLLRNQYNIGDWLKKMTKEGKRTDTNQMYKEIMSDLEDYTPNNDDIEAHRKCADNFIELGDWVWEYGERYRMCVWYDYLTYLKITSQITVLDFKQIPDFFKGQFNWNDELKLRKRMSGDEVANWVNYFYRCDYEYRCMDKYSMRTTCDRYDCGFGF